MKQVAPPSGQKPPETATVAGAELDLVALAHAATDRYYAEFPDEHERYGAVGVEWCRHDKQWLFAWAAMAAEGHLDIEEKALWLARILDARGFGVPRYLRGIELAQETAPASIAGELARAAAAVRAQYA